MKTPTRLDNIGKLWAFIAIWVTDLFPTQYDQIINTIRAEVEELPLGFDIREYQVKLLQALRWFEPS